MKYLWLFLADVLWTDEEFVEMILSGLRSKNHGELRSVRSRVVTETTTRGAEVREVKSSYSDRHQGR